jgi:hypothetical protein
MTTKTEAFAARMLDIVSRRDHASLADVVGEGAVFHTPRFLRPITDRKHIIAVLQGIVQVLPDLRYRRWWTTEHEAIMHFEGHVAGGDIIAHGIDIFTVGDDGRFTELTVFLRPTKAIEAIGTFEDALVKARLASSPSAG